MTRETRDEVLDASRGAFLSHAFSYSPNWLGSDLADTSSTFGQYFHYFPLRPATRKPFTNEMIRPRLVYATGVRIGLASGFSGSCRGANDSLPVAPPRCAASSRTRSGRSASNRVPVGGEAMLVLNNELRMPLVSILDGVVFLDIGNVFNTVRDFSLTNLRESAGFGIRVRTPWVLLRGDYGLVLDPRPGESRGRFYFSIGQAF